jgi:hypothetical protein
MTNRLTAWFRERIDAWRRAADVKRKMAATYPGVLIARSCDSSASSSVEAARRAAGRVIFHSRASVYRIFVEEWLRNRDGQVNR